MKWAVTHEIFTFSYIPVFPALMIFKRLLRTNLAANTSVPKHRIEILGVFHKTENTFSVVNIYTAKPS